MNKVVIKDAFIDALLTVSKSKDSFIAGKRVDKKWYLKNSETNIEDLPLVVKRDKHIFLVDLIKEKVGVELKHIHHLFPKDEESIEGVPNILLQVRGVTVLNLSNSIFSKKLANPNSRIDFGNEIVRLGCNFISEYLGVGHFDLSGSIWRSLGYYVSGSESDNVIGKDDIGGYAVIEFNTSIGDISPSVRDVPSIVNLVAKHKHRGVTRNNLAVLYEDVEKLPTINPYKIKLTVLKYLVDNDIPAEGNVCVDIEYYLHCLFRKEVRTHADYKSVRRWQM